MSSFFESLYANGALLTLWGALLFHLLIPIPPAAHPVRFWQRSLTHIANKVNSPVTSAQQQQLSGVLALMLVLLPTWAVLMALQSLVWKVEFYQLALLLLAVEWRGNELFTRHFIDALAKEDKSSARHLLASRVNRETASLSLLGLGKAGAESVIMGYARNVIGVLFWFGVAGGIGALMYRLCSELARNWSPNRPGYHTFGKPAARLFTLIDYIPQKLFSITVLLGMPIKTVQDTLSQAKAWSNRATNWLICGYANRFGLALGGPAIYGDEKLQRARIGGKIAPAAIHVAQIQKHIAWRVYLWLMLQSAVMFIFYQGL
ncbi:cobalamin biosynthesis family protein [Vibrio sp. 10N]|uniref:cobalamin biosynthesis family protein n=1 Tax=Vibrio sp. 10N TaxID=3058938 RepID=UPI00281403B7|nr:cobalamin biosynthesis family protein [Vibrio sp. 10N]